MIKDDTKSLSSCKVHELIQFAMWRGSLRGWGGSSVREVLAGFRSLVPKERLSMALQICNCRTEERGQRQEEAHWPASLAKMDAPGSVKRPGLKNKGKEGWEDGSRVKNSVPSITMGGSRLQGNLMLSSGFWGHLHSYAQTHTYTQVHRIKNKISLT